MPRISYYKHNRLQQLRGFCHAALAGSMSRAAQQLELSQPSVSLQIQALEREFGATLFERKGPRIRLTPEGRALYDLAAPLVQAIDGLRENFASQRGQVSGGRLDIAAGESTLLYLLPRYVSEFSRQFAGVELVLHNVTGRGGLAMLRADEVDFAVGSMVEEYADIEYQPMFAYEPMLIAPAGHPLASRSRITMRDIARHPLILPPRELTTWTVVESAFQHHNLKYQVRMEVGGWEVIKQYVELGMGISIVMSICLTGRERLFTWPVGGLFPKRTYGLVLRRSKFLSPQAQRFIEILRQGAREDRPAGKLDSTPAIRRRARGSRAAAREPEARQSR
jgi:DNA-binding transcriptional LysR family regulator